MFHVLCWFIILFRLLSVIVTFYSEFQTVISVTVQNRTHVYMNFFHHKDLGNHLVQLCPKVVKHPVEAEK